MSDERRRAQWRAASERYRQRNMEASCERVKKWRSETPKGKYQVQKQHAKQRGVDWDFTFDDWWAIWEPHWDKRGTGAGQLCMCRLDHSKGYAPNNVRIDTNLSNAQEKRSV